MGRIHAQGAVRPFLERPAVSIETFGTEPRQWLLDHACVPKDLLPAWRAVADQLRGKLPKLGALMDGVEHEVLSYMNFPRAHWLQIHSTNPLERLNAEIKRRTNVVGIFPNDAAVTPLVGAMLLEQNDEWSLNRRYMQLEGLQTLTDTAPTRLPAVQR